MAQRARDAGCAPQGRRHHLLHEGHAQPLGDERPARPAQRHAQPRRGEPLAQLAEHLADAFHLQCPVAGVAGIGRLPRFGSSATANTRSSDPTSMPTCMVSGMRCAISRILSNVAFAQVERAFFLCVPPPSPPAPHCSVQFYSTSCLNKIDKSATFVQQQGDHAERRKRSPAGAGDEQAPGQQAAGCGTRGRRGNGPPDAADATARAGEKRCPVAHPAHSAPKCTRAAKAAHRTASAAATAAGGANRESAKAAPTNASTPYS